MESEGSQLITVEGRKESHNVVEMDCSSSVYVACMAVSHSCHGCSHTSGNLPRLRTLRLAS